MKISSAIPVSSIPPRSPLLARPGFSLGAMIIGLAASALLVIGGLFDPRQFFQSYLLGFVFWVEPALGCLALLMLYRLVNGHWGRATRRFLESGSLTLPLMALLFIPICFGMAYLYPWTHEAVVAQSHYLQHKQPYLNVPFWLIRQGIYFAVWIALAWLAARWIGREIVADSDEKRLLARDRASSLSAVGLILFVLTVNFASYDWTMSLEPEWYSSMYGFLFITQQAPVVFALLILSAIHSDWTGYLARFMVPRHFRDLGTLLFAFTIIWAYSNFFQFMLIWAGNLPHEVTWYVHRSQGGWQYLAIFFFLFHFVLPFLVLLARRVRSNLSVMPWIAGGLWVSHLVYMFWFIVPSFHPEGFTLHWMDFAAVAGIGGIWCRFYLFHLRRRPIERDEEVYENIARDTDGEKAHV